MILSDVTKMTLEQIMQELDQIVWHGTEDLSEMSELIEESEALIGEHLTRARALVDELDWRIRLRPVLKETSGGKKR